MNKFHIRYNVQHKNGISEFPWKIIQDDQIFLVKEFHVNVPTKSSTNIENGDTKWTVVCEGVMRIENDIATIE